MSPSTPVRVPPQVVAHVCSWVSRAAGLTARLSLGCLVLSAALLLAVVFYRLALHPLSRIPGPRLAAVTNGWLAYNVRNGRMLQLGKTLHERYGPAVRVGPNEVWFNSTDAFKLIYSKSVTRYRAVLHCIASSCRVSTAVRHALLCPLCASFRVSLHRHKLTLYQVLLMAMKSHPFTVRDTTSGFACSL